MTRRVIPGGLRGILFDWDGTLLDSFQADSQAFLAMFREIGIAWGIEDLERHYSPDWYRMYRAARLPRARWEEADRIWGKHYRKSEPALFNFDGFLREGVGDPRQAQLAVRFTF